MSERKDDRFVREVDPAFEDLLDFIRDSRGFDFTGYKRASLLRRVTKRMHDVGVANFDDYRILLTDDSEEFNELFTTVLINVTNFMRDASAWDYLRETIIPGIVSQKDENEPIRVWSAGCASGEEAYSLAMLFAETCGEERFKKTVKIYGTDIDEDALSQARQARFRTGDVRGSLPENLADTYFRFSDGVASFRKDLRRQVIYGRNDLLRDPPISRIDLLLCRNTLMYFNSEVQNRILSNFHFALRDGGYLFLGKSEVLLTREHVFKPVDLKRRIFVKSPGTRRLEKRAPLEPQNPQPIKVAKIAVTKDTESPRDTTGLAEVSVDAEQALTEINQLAREIFSLTDDDIGQFLKDIELSYKPVELRSLIEQVQENFEPVRVQGVELSRRDQVSRYLDVRVVPLLDREGLYIGATISFNDVTKYKDLQDQLQNSKIELEGAYEELQSTVEELETTNEELQSTNEELETTNEELQSANEELETMNEELQSSNEELETINEELRSRTEDLNGANSFLGSILGSLQSAVVVVGNDLQILIWSALAESLWGVRGDEVQGRNFLNLNIGLPVERLHPLLKSCLTGNAVVERIELPAINRLGRSITCRIQVTALNDETEDNVVTGAILVMNAVDGDEHMAPELVEE